MTEASTSRRRTTLRVVAGFAVLIAAFVGGRVTATDHTVAVPVAASGRARAHARHANGRRSSNSSQSSSSSAPNTSSAAPSTTTG